MSYVPPSPAKANTWMSFWSLALRPALIPAATDAAVSIVVWKRGTLKLLLGYSPSIAVRHDAGIVTMVLAPTIRSTWCTTRIPPQPGQALCPEEISFFPCPEISTCLLLAKRVPDHHALVSCKPPLNHVPSRPVHQGQPPHPLGEVPSHIRIKPP